MPEMSWFMTKESNDSFKELLLDTLQKTFVMTFEELIKASGTGDVIAAMKPHMKLTYRDYFEATKKVMEIKGKEADSLIAVFMAGQEFVVPWDQLEGEMTELGAVGTVHGCPFQNSIPEICVYMSHFSSEAVCQLMNPEYECIFTHHLTDGDEYCRYIFKKKSQRLVDPQDLGKTISKLPEVKIPEEKLFPMKLGGIVMQLNGVTSAFVQMNGVDNAKKILYPKAKKIGEELGLEIKELMPTAGQNAETLGHIAQSITGILNQRGSSNFISEQEFVMQVTDCSCQTFSPELCGQLGAIMNGVVGTLNPEFEFKYDRMMTQGDKICHWAIKKKAIEPLEGPLNLLKTRLAKGEINEEEYKRLKLLIDN